MSKWLTAKTVKILKQKKLMNLNLFERLAKTFAVKELAWIVSFPTKVIQFEIIAQYSNFGDFIK